MPKIIKNYINKYNIRGSFFRNLHVKGLDFSYIKNVPHPYREKVNEESYQKIILAVNKKISELIVNGVDVVLPYDLFEFYIMKEPVRSYFDFLGEARTNRMIDYKMTNKLWNENYEARKDKDFIYFFGDYVCHICVVTNAYIKSAKNYVFIPLNRVYYAMRDKFVKGEIDGVDFIKRPRKLKYLDEVENNRYLS